MTMTEQELFAIERDREYVSPHKVIVSRDGFTNICCEIRRLWRDVESLQQLDMEHCLGAQDLAEQLDKIENVFTDLRTSLTRVNQEIDYLELDIPPWRLTSLRDAVITVSKHEGSVTRLINEGVSHDDEGEDIHGNIG